MQAAELKAQVQVSQKQIQDHSPANMTRSLSISGGKDAQFSTLLKPEEDPNFDRDPNAVEAIMNT